MARRKTRRRSRRRSLGGLGVYSRRSARYGMSPFERDMIGQDHLRTRYSFRANKWKYLAAAVLAYVIIRQMQGRPVAGLGALGFSFRKAFKRAGRFALAPATMVPGAVKKVVKAGGPLPFALAPGAAAGGVASGVFSRFFSR